tara:strand:+ start:221 stop:433 length:213 start_codon:yes stop_codon:yes gene_type:complete
MTLGVIISAVGLFGFLICIQRAFKIKKFASDRTQDQAELKNLFAPLYVLNMISLCFSLFGLLLVIIGRIF